MSEWKCPACKWMNLDQYKTCEACGEDKPQELSPQPTCPSCDRLRVLCDDLWRQLENYGAWNKDENYKQLEAQLKAEGIV